MNQRTKEKYMKLFVEVANQPEFKGSEIVRRHSVASNIITAMMDTGLIIKIDTGRYKWVMNRQPTNADAKLVSHALRVRRLNTDSIKAGQLTLQPIKRIERVAPMPVRVQEEPIHDTSNSKVIIILAVGAMVGFLIATIIWK